MKTIFKIHFTKEDIAKGPRTMIQQKQKRQSNKKVYKRDKNKNWKSSE